MLFADLTLHFQHHSIHFIRITTDTLSTLACSSHQLLASEISQSISLQLRMAPLRSWIRKGVRRFSKVDLGHLLRTATIIYQLAKAIGQGSMSESANNHQKEAAAVVSTYCSLIFSLSKHRNELFDSVRWHPSLTTKHKKPIVSTLAVAKDKLDDARLLLSSTSSPLLAHLPVITSLLVQVKAALQAAHNVLDALDAENTYNGERTHVAYSQLRRRYARQGLLQEIAANPKAASLWASLDIELIMTLLTGTKTMVSTIKRDDSRVY